MLLLFQCRWFEALVLYTGTCEFFGVVVVRVGHGTCHRQQHSGATAGPLGRHNCNKQCTASAKLTNCNQGAIAYKQKSDEWPIKKDKATGQSVLVVIGASWFPLSLGNVSFVQGHINSGTYSQKFFSITGRRGLRRPANRGAAGNQPLKCRQHYRK